MTKQEAIERLCLVMAKVNGRLTDWRDAADCICGSNAMREQDYMNDGTAIEFIERVVFEALAKSGGE